MDRELKLRASVVGSFLSGIVYILGSPLLGTASAVELRLWDKQVQKGGEDAEFCSDTSG